MSQPDSPDASSAPEVDPTEAALAALDGASLEGFEFVINADGSVTFVDFPPELLEIAYALNPDDPLVCERMDAAGGGGEGDDAG
jgi:hypothetical protein